MWQATLLVFLFPAPVLHQFSSQDGPHEQQLPVVEAAPGSGIGSLLQTSQGWLTASATAWRREPRKLGPGLSFDLETSENREQKTQMEKKKKSTVNVCFFEYRSESWVFQEQDIDKL